jgi:hypothetical protein
MVGFLIRFERRIGVFDLLRSAIKAFCFSIFVPTNPVNLCYDGITFCGLHLSG